MADTISLDKVVDPGVRKHFVDSYKQLPVRLEKIFKIETQEYETDEYKNYTGLGSLSAVTQGASYTEDNPYQAFGASFTPVKYGKLMPVTYELKKWAKVKEIWDASSMMGKAAARHVEKTGASVLINGFNTAYTSYTDGKPLFSTLHTRADGGSAMSNASATGIVYSETNQEVGLLALEDQTDDRGELISVFGTQLVLPTALRKQALIVNKSELRSDTTDNDANVYGMQEYYGLMKMVVWNHLNAAAGGSNTAWYLQDYETSQLSWQWADKPQVTRNDQIGFKTDVTYYKVFYYASKGWKDFRGMWGSKGDAGAYAS